MATLYVSGSGNDSSGNGSSGSPWRTPGKALAACSPGDTILFRNGTYNLNSSLVITKANTTWKADTGHTPVFDGGYSAALYTGGSGKNKVLPNPANGEAPLINLNAEGVTLDGLVIQNCPGKGAGLSKPYTTVKNCTFFFVYETCIHSNQTDRSVHTITIEGNTCVMGSVKIFDPDRTGDATAQSVIGMIKVGSTTGSVIIRNNYVAFGFGEGLNYGKWNKVLGGRNPALIEGNILHDINHTHIYVNRSWDVIIRNNIVFSTGQTLHKWDGDVPAGISVTDENTTTSQFSARVLVYNNLVANMYPLFRNSIQDAASGAFDDIYVGFNTFVGGPETSIEKPVKNGGTVIKAALSFGHANNSTTGLFENNLIDLTHAAHQNPTEGSISGGYKFRSNLWSTAPSSNARGAGDQYGAPALQNPGAPLRLTGTYPEFVTAWAGVNFGHNMDPRNYRLTEGSARAINNGSNGSALGGVTPPSVPRGVDFFGSGRDAHPDLGFHEYGATGTPTPICGFTHVPSATALLTGTAVAFTDASSAPGTTITGYSWVIKKAGVTQHTASTQNLNYTFGSAGAWTVEHSITTATAGSDSEVEDFVISDPVGTPAATAAFTRVPSATTVTQGTSVLFTDTSSVQNTTQTGRTWRVRTSPGGTLVASGTAATFNHLFGTAGTFTVELEIYTAAGVGDTESVTITVTASSDPTVSAGFTLSATTINAGEAVTVTANTSAAANTTITGYEWTFGDGGTATAATPSHVYNQAGLYTITLRVNTAAGVSATASASVLVRAVSSGGTFNTMIVTHRAALNTSTGAQTITATGLGSLVPKGVLIEVTAATADGAAATHALLSVGGSDGGAQWVHSRYSENGVGDSNTGRRRTDDAVILTIDGGGAQTGKASLVGFVAGGIEIDISDAFPAAYLATFTFFAGDDMSVKAATVSLGDVNQITPVNTGIDQRAVIAVSVWTGDDVASNDADMSFGFATANGVQYCVRNRDRDAQAAGNLFSRHTGKIALTGNASGGGGLGTVEAVNFASGSFGLRVGSNDMSGLPLSILAIDNQAGAHLSTERLSTGASSAHAVPFEPQAAIAIVTAAVTEDVRGADAEGEAIGLYAASSHGDGQYSAVIAAQHGGDPTATRSLSDDRLAAPTPAGGTLYAGLGTFGASDLTFSWASAPAANYILVMLAFEEGIAVEEPPDSENPPPVAEFTVDVQRGTVPFVVLFDGEPSNPQNGGALTYTWTFGDGGTATGARVRHVYHAPGVYSVSLVVANANGQDTKVRENLVTAEEEIFEEILIGPILALDVDGDTDSDFDVFMPKEGSPAYQVFGAHSHRAAWTFMRMRELTAAEIADLVTEAGYATWAYNVETHEVVIIESDGSLRYLATTS